MVWDNKEGGHNNEVARSERHNRKMGSREDVYSHMLWKDLLTRCRGSIKRDVVGDGGGVWFPYRLTNGIDIKVKGGA